MGQFTFFFYILAQVMHKEISVMDSNNFDKLSRSLSGTSSRRQALKLMGGGLIGGAAMAVGLKGATAQRPTINATAEVFDDAGDLLGTVSGLLAQVNNAGGINISGVFTDALGNITNFTTGLLTNDSTGSCEILDLVLGPLDLNLLGLVVHLDTVHLNITAQPGPGNLLGNLLCQIAGLLNGQGGGGGLLNRLANLLNQLFAGLS
jgi:hypothetical protein